ncbi:MAG: hypothetical protein U9N59_10385 [Campylobacterota bacterium]|nr:hypothetical protein [Campylobacterota bacterium]
MDMGMMIGNLIAILLMTGLVIIYIKTKDRQETLVIKKENDTLYFLLGKDEHYSCDVSDLKDDKEKIIEMVKSILNQRAKKLVSFVNSVRYMDGDDQIFEKELLSIIQG